MMNERMIELANKANAQVGYTFKLEDADQIHTLVEKFAELIVKECIQAVSDDGIKSDWYQHLIKQHFGVEE